MMMQQRAVVWWVVLLCAGLQLVAALVDEGSPVVGTSKTEADAPMRAAFEEWMRQHKKSYAHDELAYRWRVWHANQAFILDHNLRTSSNATYSLRMNAFGDLTSDEFNRLNKGLLQRTYEPIADGQPAEPTALGLPSSFDWRQQGAVTHVKNQGQCGSCWSFSATGATEAANYLKKGQLISLSEQNLIDCSTPYGNRGCGGGLMDLAFEYIYYNGGIDTEAAYPYQGVQLNCRYDPQYSGGWLVHYYNVQSGSEAALLEALSYQPVSVAIDATHPSFQFYHEGVYNEPACSQTRLDHGVLAVGWGSYQSSDYWLVKNSWGTDWGLQGYVMMSRNRNNQCGIATAASYPRC